MTRTQTAAASLVAAIPAGFLAALLVMAFLNHAENLRLMTQILVGGTLAITTAVVLMPFAILVFSGKKAAPKIAKGKAALLDDHEETLVGSAEIPVEDDEETETVIYDAGSSGETEELMESEDFETDDLGEDLGDDMILSDDEIDLENEPPAKKKKR